VITISCVFRGAEGLRVHSFVDRLPKGVSEEGRIVQQFFGTIEKKVPQLVSWNGGGFDLPVLHRG
jgi:predicted PolB exonuclease-like 3'-5' exonuclease